MAADAWERLEDSVQLLTDEEGCEAAQTQPKAKSDAVVVGGGKRKRCLATLRGSWFLQETMSLVKLAVPVVIAQYSQQTLVFISVLFVGHITGQRLELDAAALALSFATVTAVSVGWGLATAGDTLCSQAYGFKNYKRVGIILQRGILILSLAMFPIYVVWLNTETILLFLQQSPCVARLTADYINIMCWAVPFIFLFQMLQKYLQGQGIVWILGGVTVAVNILNVVLHIIFIYGAGMGFRGSAVAITLSFIALPLVLMAYVRLRGLHRLTWGGWSWESLREWRQFAGLAIPGLLMVCCELWCFEISAVLAGAISEVELGINTVMIQLLANTFQIPLGLGIAAGVRVGNELGAGHPLTAKRASYTAMTITMVNAVLLGTVLFFSRHIIAKIFTEDEEVIRGTATGMYAGIFVITFDQLAGVTAGILRGTGRQKLGAMLNFFCYYVIGLPLGIPLAFRAGLGTLGIWTGLAVADGLQAVSFTLLIVFTDWDEQSRKAVMNASSKETESRDEMEMKCIHEEPGHVTEDDGWAVGCGNEDHATGSLTCRMKNVKEHSFTQVTSCGGESEGDSLRLVPDGIVHPVNEDAAVDLHSNGRPAIASSRFISRLKLLLSRGVFLVLGLVLVTGGSIASQYYRPPISLLNGNYSECSSSSSGSGSSHNL